MTGISAYLSDKLLDCLDNASGFNVAAVYVKLHVGDPGAAGASNAAGNTTREAASFSAASAESKVTDADVPWTNVSTSETYSHVSLWDASSAGNFLWSGALTAPKAVLSGENFTLPAGSLILGLT